MRLPLLLAVTMLCAGNALAQTAADAVTADELCQYRVIQTLYGTSPMRYTPEVSIGNCYFTKTDDTHLVLHNFMQSYDMPFVLDGNTLRMDFNMSGMSAIILSGNDGAPEEMFYLGYNPNGALYTQTIYVEGYMPCLDAYEGTITREDTRHIKIEFGSRADKYALGAVASDNSNAPHFYGFQQLDCILTNATMASMLTDGTITDNVPVLVTTGNGLINIYNWDDIGWTWTTGTSDTGTPSYTLNGPLIGTYDEATRAVTIPYQQFNASTAFPEGFQYDGYNSNWGTSYGTRDWYQWPINNQARVYKNYIGSPTDGDFTGTMQPRYWRASGCDNWAVDCGGNLHTDLLNVFTFGAWKETLTTFPQGTYNGTTSVLTGNVSASVISQTVADVTLQASLHIDNYGPCHINGTITADNDEAVESYDLYAVQGTVTSIAGRTLSTTTGLTGDVRQLNRQPLQSGAFTLDDMSFWVYDPEAEQQNYTLYLKANYRATSDPQVLNPTFHALTPLSLMTTGIDDVAASTTDDPVYYDLQGRIIDPSTAHGVILRRQGATVTRIIR